MWMETENIVQDIEVHVIAATNKHSRKPDRRRRDDGWFVWSIDNRLLVTWFSICSVVELFLGVPTRLRCCWRRGVASMTWASNLWPVLITCSARADRHHEIGCCQSQIALLQSVYHTAPHWWVALPQSCYQWMCRHVLPSSKMFISLPDFALCVVVLSVWHGWDIWSQSWGLVCKVSHFLWGKSASRKKNPSSLIDTLRCPQILEFRAVLP